MREGEEGVEGEVGVGKPEKTKRETRDPRNRVRFFLIFFLLWIDNFFG